MKILVFESNLMWSSRLMQTLRKLGHEPILTQKPGPADAAIVNLGEGDPKELVAQLHASGVKVIAHAGHKEKLLHQLGRDAGADVLATNSELTYKLPQLLEGVAPSTPP